MAALDSILNFMIPFLVISGMMFLIYKSAKEPIDQFAGWIKRTIQSSMESSKDNAQEVYSEIIYE